MARIRTLKPEFWSSPGIETISPWARLLFQAMWNWADDAGRGTCNLKELQAFAFPHDDESTVVGTSDGFRRTLAEVRGRFGVVFYKVAERPYYEIPSWSRHQRNERIARGRYPASSEGQPWDFMPATSELPEPPTSPDGDSRNFRSSVTEVPTSSAPVLKEQGNRGTGEAKTSASDDAGTLIDVPSVPAPVEREFDEWWKHYPLKKGKEPARKAFVKARKARVPLEKLISAADRYALDVRGLDDSKIKYPQGWLNDMRWQDYDEPSSPRLRVVAGGGYQPYQNPDAADYETGWTS